MSEATETKTESKGSKKATKTSASTKSTGSIPAASFPYAVIRTGSKQYMVAQGDQILVERLTLEPGAVFKAEDVLFVAKAPGDFVIGQPQIKGATVEFEVLQQTLGKKVLIRHSRRRQNSQKTLGHRQPQTRLMVKAIKA